MNEELKRLLDELYTLFYCGIEQGDTISCVISWEAYKKIDEILERAKKMHGDGRINDLIGRQEAINALEEPCKVPDTWSDEYAVGERMQWEKDVKALKNLPSAQPEQRWTPCSERLPEYYEPVLTWDGDFYFVEKRIPYICDDEGKHIVSDWWVSDDYDELESDYYPNLRDGAAVAWMPLPEPWKGGQDE